jgi:muramoyltetrapeptide carboxypeptidase
MKSIKPSKLHSGDTIGVISPSSAPNDLSRVDKGVAYLERLGYRVEVGKNVGKKWGYLAGSDEERLDDLHAMFKNKDVKAIICLRGGYGSPRIIDKIDYKLIKKNPKIFVGYSDITAIQLAIYKKTGLVTFAGPMLAVDLWNDINRYSEEFFWRLLTSTKKLGRLEFPNEAKLGKITKGKMEGKILGGNLTLITAIMGSALLPSFSDSVLLLEDVDENPYRLDRMLNQLRLAGVFEQAKGVLLGAFTDCENKDPEDPSLTVAEVFNSYFSQLKIPVVSNFQHGHIKEKITVPYGIEIKVNSDKNHIEYLESAVE